VVESWSSMLEKSQCDVQLKQVRVCAEIGIECIDPNPVNRPDTQHIIDRIDETESMDEYTEAGVITSQQVRPLPWHPWHYPKKLDFESLCHFR
jgi:hypothetical protein